MNLWAVFPTICGYERVGRDQLRLYVESVTPQPNFSRQRGERSPLFHLYAGADAHAVLSWLDRNRAWQCLRVPPVFTTDLGVRAVLSAADWNSGEGSALFTLARTRVIESADHRQRLQREVRLLIEMVLENPVRPGEFWELQALEDAINAAPLGVELAATAEVVNAFFGSEGVSLGSGA